MKAIVVLDEDAFRMGKLEGVAVVNEPPTAKETKTIEEIKRVADELGLNAIEIRIDSLEDLAESLNDEFYRGTELEGREGEMDETPMATPEQIETWKKMRGW